MPSSPALRSFLHDLGKAQHHLHTTIIGLSAVEKQIATKPADLDVSWRADDPVGAAREARRFLLRSAIVFAAEITSTYAFRCLRYWQLSDSSVDTPDEAVERIRKLTSLQPVDPSYLPVAPVILRQWRNRIIHQKSNADLSRDERKQLLAEQEAVREKVKNLDVSLLLEHFADDRPSLKDVTSLVSMTIKYAREVDGHLPPVSSAAEVAKWLTLLGLRESVLSLEKQLDRGGSPDPRKKGRQLLRAKAAALANPYYEFGAG